MITLATALFSQSALRFVLLGAATGALTALVALGIVLVYRTSGVLNFSAGALGGIAAYVCYDLRDGGLPTALAVTLGLLTGVGLGLLTLRGDGVAPRCVEPRAAHRDARAVQHLPGVHGAAVGGRGAASRGSLLPSKNVTLFGDLIIGRDRLVLIGVALLLAARAARRLLRHAVRPGDFGRRREPARRRERGMVARPHRDGELRDRGRTVGARRDLPGPHRHA